MWNVDLQKTCVFANSQIDIVDFRQIDFREIDIDFQFN